MFVHNIRFAKDFKKAQNQPNFGSKNCPIEPFIHGPLNIRELPETECENAAKFYFDFCIDAFNDWKEYFNSKPQEAKQTSINKIKERLFNAINQPDGNGTVLIANKPKEGIKALFMMHSFDELKNAKPSVVDEKTGYIESCYLSREYQRKGIGSLLLDKLLQTAQGHYTDLFLEADSNALNLYKRAGFLSLDVTNPQIKKISDYILANRDDADELILMSKSLDQKNPWWQRVARQIK